MKNKESVAPEHACHFVWQFFLNAAVLEMRRTMYEYSVMDSKNKNADKVEGLFNNASGLFSNQSQAGGGLLPQEGIVQRKVGLEFQVVSGGNDIMKKKHGEWMGGIGHGDILAEKNGIKVTNDGGDYEYVTVPVDERSDEGINTLMSACQQAADFHKNMLVNLRSENDSYRFDESAGRAYIQAPGNNKEFYVQQSNNLKAHPQATVGIKLEKLAEFAEVYTFNRTNNRNYRPNYPSRIEELKLAHGGTRGKLMNDQVESNRRIQLREQQKELSQSIAAVVGNHMSSEDDKKKYGFLSILASMVQNFDAYITKEGFDVRQEEGRPLEEVLPINAKTAMPIMPRTSLYDAFLKLPSEVQDEIRDIEHHSELLEFVVGSSQRRLNSRRQIVSGGDIMDTVIAGEGKEDRTKKIYCEAVTLREWISNLPDNSALAKEDVLASDQKGFISVAELSGMEGDFHPPEAYRGSLRRSTDIGYDEVLPASGGQGNRQDDAAGETRQKVEGMILEIRDLQRGVPCDDWEYIARDVALLTRYVNLGRMTEEEPRDNVQDIPARAVAVQGGMAGEYSSEGSDIVSGHPAGQGSRESGFWAWLAGCCCGCCD